VSFNLSAEDELDLAKYTPAQTAVDPDTTASTKAISLHASPE
jgi:hypothetical protein